MGNLFGAGGERTSAPRGFLGREGVSRLGGDVVRRLEMVADDGEPFDVNLQALFGAPPTEQASLTAVYGGSGTPADLAKIIGAYQLG